MRTRWQRVRDLFERALEEQPADLDAWLEREAPDDPDVRAEVRSLVAQHSLASHFLTEPVPDPDPSLPDEDAAYPAGHVIGHYTIMRELGGGGMGRVYLARDTNLGRPVALKVIAPRHTGNPEYRERLKREAQAAARLSHHPGICAVYALEEFEGELFIVAEYVKGHTLRHEITDRNKLNSRPLHTEILRTAREIASALGAAHAEGIIHRDLKPENVMRTVDGRVKILDFGLARTDILVTDALAPQLTMTGVALGTPAYMAPEQLTRLPVDARTDVFAFGVLMYELASGVHPFLSEPTRILHTEATPIERLCPTMSLAACSVIDRCLRKSPADRFASAREIATALPNESNESKTLIGPAVRWWRAHQAIIVGLYFLASVFAWFIKEGPSSEALAVFGDVVFGVVSVAATVGGVMRSHLLFVERINRLALADELRRTGFITMVTDAVIAFALSFDGVTLFPSGRDVAAVLIACLGIGIVLARLGLEPSTERNAFGQ
jgi:predicted Ser/Thr protein kinase